MNTDFFSNSKCVIPPNRNKIFCLSQVVRDSLSSVWYNLLQLVLSAGVAALKCRPVLHHCVVIFFSGPQWPLTVCLHLKKKFRSCARGRQWCVICHYHWWTASKKPRLLFSHSGLVSWGLPFLICILSKSDCVVTDIHVLSSLCVCRKSSERKPCTCVFLSKSIKWHILYWRC